MIMKQGFSLEEYLADTSRKVVTRDGKPVRIICTDADRKNPIVALVNEGTDKIFCYQPNGSCMIMQPAITTFSLKRQRKMAT